ncbi:MAG: hypothetical protein ACFE7R_10505 [Candidatus Hodarchaeota archaeon]
MPHFKLSRHSEVFITRYPTYDGSKSSERPVRLEKTEGHIVIEGRAYPARELVEALVQSGYAELRAVGDSLILGRKRITPIFKSRQDRAMASLCHGSLAFCCPDSKRCAERDRALEMLGLTLNEYNRLKEDAHLRFVETAKGIPFDRPESHSSHTQERSVNQPAVDRGYGADDYCRDFDSLDTAMHSSRRIPDRETHSWASDHPSHQSPRGGQPFLDNKDSYSDLSNLFGDDSSSSGIGSAPICRMRSGEDIEGIGSLFAQGELSPFNDDTQDNREGRMFCFSCGRTFRAGTKVCPWCGVSQ